MGIMGYGFLMMLFGFLVLVGVLILIVLAILHFTGSAWLQGSAGSSARRILDERYARGEIGPEEYQRIRQELT
ncbi:MAG: hypothetical protein DLM67_12590 [Candidatus Nephthysia bennettiae]|uniref:SHOCT domain-containing protein n=2 Tax=Candidatus Nephthysia bennettiae TaxID=3127016 RepID=A0A934K5K2_9BACT|nr:SHOCT domain-containing protein [Candidatus Dormibacteraeota bacterium]PZR94342.1 MAG: hypothetical protein DLM67_12590 [Candidatus Dormibacteraeota bacterium]